MFVYIIPTNKVKIIKGRRRRKKEEDLIYNYIIIIILKKKNNSFLLLSLYANPIYIFNVKK
jgi:hypothetical protein